MSIDTIAARTNSAGGAVTPDWKAEERRMAYMLWKEGVVPSPLDAYEVVAGAGGTMNIVVGSGAAETDLAIVKGLVAGQGNYMVRLDEATKTITLDAAGASLRVDEVYLVVYDNPYDGQSRALPRFSIRKGDAGGANPGPDANWDAYLLLARVSIPASAPNIGACTITDVRVFTTTIMESTNVDAAIQAAIDAFPIRGASDFSSNEEVTGSTFVTAMTGTVAIPDSWTAVTVTAWVHYHVEEIASGAELRFQIEGVNGPTYFPSSVPEYESYAHGRSIGSPDSSISVLVQIRCTGGTLELHNVTLTVVAEGA
jgi:hypothetical protein